MPKISSRCSICKLPTADRDGFHTDKWVNHFTHSQLAAKYFPQRSEVAVLKSCTTHFQDHFPFDEFVNEIVDEKTKSDGANLPAVSATERSIFTEAYQTRLDSVRTIESMMRTLMERANYIQDEWSKVHIATKCEKCGRDDTGPNLVKILAIFKELREQVDAWTKMRNPMAAVNKIAEKAFVSFVEEMTDVYVLVISEKSRLIRDAVNDFLAEKINQGMFAKRVTEALDDFGGDRISSAAQEKYQKIFATVMKELKL